MIAVNCYLFYYYLFFKALPSVGLAGPSRRCTALTHRGVLVDQQVGVEEVVYEVGQPVAPAWEEDKNWIFFSGLARAGENQGREGDQTALAAGMVRGAPRPTPNPAAEGQGWLLQKPRPFFFQRFPWQGGG